MVRTQIQLTEEQMADLKKLAAERGVSVAELVREGVQALLRASRGGTREEKKRRALAAVGKFRSGVTDLSTRHDDYFAEAVEQ
jgi:Arc/MetJ-type ribon-helix-helix transcriptional regulator